MILFAIGAIIGTIIFLIGSSGYFSAGNRYYRKERKRYQKSIHRRN